MNFNLTEARDRAKGDDGRILSYLQGKGEIEFDFDTAMKRADGNATRVINYLESSGKLTNTAEPSIITPTEDEVKVTNILGFTQPSDVKATEPTTLDLGMYDVEGNLQPIDVGAPQYISEPARQQRDMAELDKRMEGVQEEATSSSFPIDVVDPTSGEKITVEPQGLQMDLPVLIGKLATVRFITPDMEKAFGLQAANMLSKEAQLILSRNPEGLGMDEAAKILEGVPKQDQALALANRLGHETIGNIKQAVKDGAEDRIALANELRRRKDKILESVGPVDVNSAKAKYADMVEEVAKDYHNVRDASPILEDLDFLEKFYGTTPSRANTVVNQMKTVISDTPNINLSDALEFRGDINYLISKASRGKEKAKLNSIKDNIDAFINSVATPEQQVIIDEAITTYSRTMNNRDLLEVIAKSTKEDRVVDWTKLSHSLDEANLKSPEVELATKITKEFAERFKNDAKLISDSTVKGSNPDSGGVLGAWGYIVNQLKDKFAMWGNRHDNLKIQDAIIKSIRKSKTSLDFVDDIAKSEVIPKEFKKTLLLDYKPGMSTGDRNLNVLYATRKGLVSEDISKVSLINAQTKRVDDFLGNPELTEKVMPTINRFMEGKRANSILSDVSARMKADDMAGNQRMLEGIIRNEVDEMVKAINKEAGVQLPASEVNKIYRMKIADLLKECE